LAPVTRWRHHDEENLGGFTQPWVIPAAELAVGIRFGHAVQRADAPAPVLPAPEVTMPKSAPHSGSETTGSPQLSTLGGMRTPRGPRPPQPEVPPDPPQPAAPTPRGEPLPPDDIQRTVSRYTRAVNQRCWQRELDLREPSGARTARVSVKLVVAPDGTVRRITSSGDPPGYRDLARCITTEVEHWKFPCATGETEVDVPFVFAAQ
jgi:hypothetical protein